MANTPTLLQSSCPSPSSVPRHTHTLSYFGDALHVWHLAGTPDPSRDARMLDVALSICTLLLPCLQHLNEDTDSLDVAVAFPGLGVSWLPRNPSRRLKLPDFGSLRPIQLLYLSSGSGVNAGPRPNLRGDSLFEAPWLSFRRPGGPPFSFTRT